MQDRRSGPDPMLDAAARDRRAVLKVGAASAAALLSGGVPGNVQAQQAKAPTGDDRPSGAAGVLPIWPGSGVAPGSEEWTWREQTAGKAPNRMVRNVAIPTVTMFKPAEGRANGTSLIVAPGGAFHFLAIDHEGYDMARWLAGLGVTAFVLKYRLARTPDNDAELPAFLARLFSDLPHPGPTEVDPPVGTKATEEARSWAEEDGRQAIRFVRQHAAEWGLDPKRIGIAGFSAGGGVVMGAVMKHDAESRPDFAAGIYPGYRTATPVPADAPPLFLAISDDDKAVAPISAARLYEAWHKAGKPVELHIFAKGGHGFGMTKRDRLSDPWADLFKHWLTAYGYLPRAGK